MCGIGVELGGLDPMMLTADHTPQPCEVAFCKIGMNAVEAVSLGMINTFHREGGGEHIPVPKIVGSDHAALGDAFSCESNAIALQSKRPSQRPSGTLAQSYNHASPIRPILEKTSIDAVGFEIGLAHMATEISTIHLDRIAQPQPGRLGRQRLAQLVGEHEGRFVLHIKITAASRSTKESFRHAKIVPEVTLNW